jgi:hypothetical protein
MADRPNRPWTAAEIKQALAICTTSRNRYEACRLIQERIGRSISADNLTRLFISRGLPSPQSLLRSDPVERVDPIERVVAKEADSALKREHKHLVERLREAEARQVVLDSLNRPVEILKISRREKTSGLREGTAVILASDWHVEEHVPLRSDTWGNYYDLEVADRRVRRFFDGAAWLINTQRQVFALRDVLLWLGGDLITGYLRNENREENQLSPTQAIAWLKARLVLGIDSFLADKKTERLVIVCSHGNHGRTTEKRQISTGAHNSYEWLLYQWLADHYRDNKRVSVVTDSANHQYVQVYDFNLHFHHGDEVKYQGGIGGIAVPLMKAVAGWNAVRHCHYHHMGHWHQYSDFGSVTVNGSLIGYNAYAMSVRAKPEAPQQAFYVLDSKRGKTAMHPIWVTGDEERSHAVA